MNNATSTQVFDFASSFRRTLDRFDKLTASSRADYSRAVEKWAQSEAVEQHAVQLQPGLQRD